MAYDKFIIGYVDDKSGYQSNLKPFLINDNAFDLIENAYVFRGRVRKRFGSVYMGTDQLESRLGVLLGQVEGDGTFSKTVPGTIFAVGQMFSIGSDIFTVSVAGTPGVMITNSVSGSGTYDTTSGAVAFTDEVAGMDVWFYPSTAVMGLDLYFTPVSLVYDNIGFDQQFSYAFDKLNYRWSRLSLENQSGAATWTGSDSKFFWIINYRGSSPYMNWLWVTNNNPADGIRYFDGVYWNRPLLNYTRGLIIGTSDSSGSVSINNIVMADIFVGQTFTFGKYFFTVTQSTLSSPYELQVTGSWTGTATLDPTNPGTGIGTLTLTPSGDTTLYPKTAVYWSGNNYIKTSQIIIPFHNRLLLFNTTELINGVEHKYVNRMRYSSLGNPVSPDAWMQDVNGAGGARDCPTQQEIKTVEFIKDRLIVYLEQCTYEVVFTGNLLQPFLWQKLNTELGADSTFSSIPFDKAVLAIDSIGIHACNGSNVERIDNKIPSLVWSFNTEQSDKNRVAGIRDFYTEQAYWTYLSTDRNSSFKYPNKILIYNYVNDAWAVFDDSFTTFGYYLMLSGTPGATWGSTTIPWGQNTSLWNSSSDATNVEQNKRIIAGNQQGFVVVINADLLTNASCLQVTNFVSLGEGKATITIINHNLSSGDFIKLSTMNGLTFIDNNIPSNTLDDVVCMVYSDTVNDMSTNTFTGLLLDNNQLPRKNSMNITGTYLGGGTAARMSVIDIKTKQYNFYTSDDRNIHIPKINFLVDKTQCGAITADYYVSSTSISIVNESISTLSNPLGPLPGSNVLETSPYDALLAPLERFQERLWHPVYFYGDGECVQFRLYMSNQQMFEYIVTRGDATSIDFVADEDFQLHSMIIYSRPTSPRLQ